MITDEVTKRREAEAKNWVERKIAEANRYLAEKNGINPNSESYKENKAIIRYAFDHHISVGEAIMELRKVRRSNNERRKQ